MARRNPPVEHQFKKGQSGNSGGRPRGSGRKPEPHFFDGLVKVPTADGKRKSVTRGDYLLQQFTKTAIATKDDELADYILTTKAAIDRAQERSSHAAIIFWNNMWSAEKPVCDIDDALRHLGAVKVLYRCTTKARMRIEPWAVMQALSKLDCELTREEQEIVYAATRCPHHVKWPPYWSADLRGKKRKQAELGDDEL